ncbi:hypothetical protein [Ferviditalea candida]|uniref:Hydrolase n=1 Tax=Ferviditalea candida TaxID=3108399 RepID=A0ABU5ZEE6_9BACL|nr:hypothetical protein [Paenibacillaceae bacterium T2]
MEKKKYYISVQSGSILEDQGAAAYELEIEATEAEAAKLQELFDARMTEEDATFVRNHIPAIPYHNDKENDAYDYYLKEIYQMIYNLGTEETRKHIESIGVLSPGFFPYP